MPTLYRKYRPSVFADVEAQEHVVTTIKNEIIAGALAHAYLFSGPRGVGKTTLARLLAKAVICTDRKKGSAEPCNTCNNCEAVNASRHIDVIEIDAASHTGVDNVRENIIENARFQPTSAPYKIFIIDEVHMLSSSAFNALLKTLEEPPAHVIFILATTELYKLPATVLSRCQRFQFKRLSHDELIHKLKKICEAESVNVEKAVLERIAAVSDGALRDAESILGQLVSLGTKKITVEDSIAVLPATDLGTVIELVEHVAVNESAQALATLAKASELGSEAMHFTDELITVLRDILVFKTTNNESDLARFDSGGTKAVRALAKELATETIGRMLDNAIMRRGQIRLSPHPFIPLELWATMGTLHSSTPPATPVQKVTPTEKKAPDEKATNTAPAPTKAAAAPTETKAPSFGATIKSAISSLTGHNEPPKTPLEDIKAKWSELVPAISKHNHALTFILSMATVHSVDSSGVHLAVPYSLHRDKLLENKNKHIIEQCLREAFNEHIALACDVIGETKAPEPDVDLSGVALEFGGEVVG